MDIVILFELAVKSSVIIHTIKGRFRIYEMGGGTSCKSFYGEVAYFIVEVLKRLQTLIKDFMSFEECCLRRESSL